MGHADSGVRMVNVGVCASLAFDGAVALEGRMTYLVGIGAHGGI